MKLSSDEVQRWKFIGNYLVRGWVYTGPDDDDEAYIEDTLRRYPNILSNRLWFDITEDEVGEEEYFKGIVTGKHRATDLVYDKSRIENEVEKAFFHLIETFWNLDMQPVTQMDRRWFVDHIIEEPEASELMFVVIANNLELDAEGKITNLEYSYQRGVEAAIGYMDASFEVVPPIEPWEATG